MLLPHSEGFAVEPAVQFARLCHNHPFAREADVGLDDREAITHRCHPCQEGIHIFGRQVVQDPETQDDVEPAISFASEIPNVALRDLHVVEAKAFGRELRLGDMALPPLDAPDTSTVRCELGCEAAFIGAEIENTKLGQRLGRVIRDDLKDARRMLSSAAPTSPGDIV